jgi:hypothetical protein
VSSRARSLSPLYARRASFTTREPSSPYRGHGRSPVPSTLDARRLSLYESDPPASEDISPYYGGGDSRSSRGGSTRGGRFPDGGGRGGKSTHVVSLPGSCALYGRIWTSVLS